ncbi:protein delta homolog 1-like, partial [Corticium candelabrum]|uniref:protein delta homolog 1-like n=1 Tax=Corticium candelabrum TaxID=121492 RepID=UPI002E2706F1
GGLNLEVNVSNYYTSPPAFIGSFVYEDSSTSFGDFSSLIILSDLSKTKSLDIKWRVRCSDHFYNEDCFIFCKPVDDVSGHYDCLSNGTKRCLPGWTNPQNNCTTALCASEPCQNNGSCIIEFGEIKCNCIIGYTGDYCETNIDECSSSPCQNNGTCHDDVNSYSCLCKVGYMGINCETSHLPTPFISTKIGCNSSFIQPTSRITYDKTADIIGYSVQLTSIHGQINLEFLLNNNTDHVFLEELQQDTLYTFQIRPRSINGLGIASSSHMLRCENKETNVRLPITATVATATLVISISVILLVLAACYFYRGRRLTSTVDTVTKMNTTELDKQEQMNEDVTYETVVDTDFSTEVITRSQLYEETPMVLTRSQLYEETPMVLTRSQLYMYAEPSAEVVDNQPYT